MERRSSTNDSCRRTSLKGKRKSHCDQRNTQAAAAPVFLVDSFPPTRSVATQLLNLSALDGAKLQHPSACQADHLRFTPRQNFGCPLSRESRRLVSFSPAGTYCGDTSVSKHPKSSAAERAGNARALATRCRAAPHRAPRQRKLPGTGSGENLATGPHRGACLTITSGENKNRLATVCNSPWPSLCRSTLPSSHYTTRSRHKALTSGGASRVRASNRRHAQRSNINNQFNKLR